MLEVQKNNHNNIINNLYLPRDIFSVAPNDSPQLRVAMLVSFQQVLWGSGASGFSELPGPLLGLLSSTFSEAQVGDVCSIPNNS